MISDMLQIQQYLNIHPVIKEDKKTRDRYLLLLNYFIGKQAVRNLWSKRVLELYRRQLSGEFGVSTCKSTKDGTKLFKYRNYLLTDCLFICCFDDKKKGELFLENFVTFYGKRYRKSFTQMIKGFYSYTDSFVVHNDNNLAAIYRIIRNNREFLNKKTLRIMVTANMSAGKSTLLNALVGRKISKTQNESCTAKIHYLYNKAGDDGFAYELDHDLELDASIDILMNDNCDNKENDISVGTRFRSIREIDKRLCFIDTPGVNFSMDKTHREITNETIVKVPADVLIYLFNGESVGSDEEFVHLSFVKEHYSGKIIFLINRIDQYRKGVDSVKGTLDKIKEDLVNMGFRDPEVFPVSAYAGYLCKMALNGEELTEDEMDELELLKRKLKREEFSYEKYYGENGDGQSYQDEFEELLLHSGILSLEKMLYE